MISYIIKVSTKPGVAAAVRVCWVVSESVLVHEYANRGEGATGCFAVL